MGWLSPCQRKVFLHGSVSHCLIGLLTKLWELQKVGITLTSAKWASDSKVWGTGLLTVLTRSTRKVLPNRGRGYEDTR